MSVILRAAICVNKRCVTIGNIEIISQGKISINDWHDLPEDLFTMIEAIGRIMTINAGGSISYTEVLQRIARILQLMEYDINILEQPSDEGWIIFLN